MATRSPTALPERSQSQAAYPIPPQESGDRLTADEFERRYHAKRHVKAELIEGVVYVASPVSDDNGAPHLDLATWIGTYRAHTPGIAGSDNGTLRLDVNNRPGPDLHLRIVPACGGQARLSEDRYVLGAPELVVDVARSSANYDFHDKLNAYCRNEVREYVIWRVEDGILDWLVLRGAAYQPLAKSADGLYRSIVLPGLWLDPAAVLRRDVITVLQVVQAGLASPEHADFIGRLREAAERAAGRPAP